MTEPLTPAACDLTDYPSMLLDVARLRRSKAWLKCKRTPMLAFYMLNLWTAAWHDKPAASLENDDDVLADLAMCDPGKWAKVRDDALHGWVLCSDGRLYHPVVAEKALECWLDKLARTLSSGAGNAKRWKTPFDPMPIEAQMKAAKDLLAALNPNSKALTKRKTSGVPFHADSDAGGTPDLIPPGSQEKVNGSRMEGEGSSEPTGSADAGAPAAVDKSTNPETPEDRRARRMVWLSKHGVTDAGEARAFMNTVAKDWGGAVAAEAFETAMASDGPFGDPKALVIGCAKNLTEHTRAIHAHANTVPSGAAEKTAEYLAERAAIVGAPPPAGLKSIRAAIAGAGLHTPEVAA